MSKKETMTPEEIDKQLFLQLQPQRQKASAVSLLFVSNMLTDFQLNPNFRFQHPKERDLWLALRELLNLPIEITEESVKVIVKDHD